MKLFKLSIFFVILLTAFSACRKDNLVIDDKEKDENPIVIIKYEIETSGVVTDRLGSPIRNVEVNLGSSFTTTDQNGYFKLTGLANADKGIFKIEKQGYFTVYPVFYPEEGIGQHITVELMDRVAIGSVNNTSKTVTINQHQIDFSDATFKDNNGTPYSDEVIVYATYLDPTDEHLDRFMSGDLVGINTEDEEQILTSYGMLNVELEDVNGNELNIDGEAELTMEVPSTILNQAPATIPLWYFDEDSGNWIEEGEATLVGNQYIGKVTHFTLWNCDYPRDLVTINGFVNTIFNPQSLIIKVTGSDGDSKSTKLNESLRFSGKVPANETLNLEIFDPCGTVLISQTIGPFSSDASLGGFDIGGNSSLKLTISGSIVDCNMNPISNGYVNISDDNNHSQIIAVDSDGNFNTTVAWCNTGTVNVISFDSDENKIGEIVHLDYMETLSTGNLITCNTFVSGIQISGPEINKFFPIQFYSTHPLIFAPYAFIIEAVDDDGNGNKVTYSPGLISNGINSTVVSLSMLGKSVEGSPTEVISWGDLDDPDILTIINNPTPGGVIDARYENVDVEVLDANFQTIATHPGHTIRVTLLLD